MWYTVEKMGGEFTAEKLNKAVQWLVRAALILALSLCMILLVIRLVQSVHLQSGALVESALFPVGCAALVIFAFVLIFLLRIVMRIPGLSWVLFVAVAGISLTACIVLNPPLESDFQLLYDAALQLRRGDRTYTSYVYFTLWGYQSVYVAWEAALLSIWENPRMIQIVHSLLFSGSVVLLYRLMRGLVSERAARMASVLLLIFPFFVTLPSVLTNQIPGAFFLLLGIFFLISPEARSLGVWRFLLGGVTLQLGNLFRPEGGLILAALTAGGIVWLFSHPQHWRSLLLSAVLVLAAYFLVGRIADALTIWSGLNPVGLGNGNLLWKFVVGLNHDSGGMYTNADWYAVLRTLSPEGFVTEETLILEHSLLAERLAQPLAQWIQLLLAKVENLWAREGLYWALSRWREKWALAYSMLTWFGRLVALTAMAFAALGAVLVRCRGAAAILPRLAVLAAFCAFLLVEVQPRYSYLPYFFVFWCAAYGMEAMLSWRRKELTE